MSRDDSAAVGSAAEVLALEAVDVSTLFEVGRYVLGADSVVLSRNTS